MAQQEEIVLWLDHRWKKAIERHLKNETLQEHLENVLDELCNQLPAHEYERISNVIQSEAAAQRAEEEAARTRPRSVRSCWMPAKSCAATLLPTRVLRQICSSKCLQAASPSQQRSTMH